MQFSFGHVHFAIQSDIDLIRNDEIIATWREGEWPSPEFYQIMNIDVTKYEIPNDRQIIIYLENQIEIHLHDNVDQYECMQISIDGVAGQWII